MLSPPRTKLLTPFIPFREPCPIHRCSSPRGEGEALPSISGRGVTTAASPESEEPPPWTGPSSHAAPTPRRTPRRARPRANRLRLAEQRGEEEREEALSLHHHHFASEVPHAVASRDRQTGVWNTAGVVSLDVPPEDLWPLVKSISLGEAGGHVLRNVRRSTRREEECVPGRSGTGEGGGGSLRRESPHETEARAILLARAPFMPCRGAVMPYLNNSRRGPEATVTEGLISPSPPHPTPPLPRPSSPPPSPALLEQDCHWKFFLLGGHVRLVTRVEAVRLSYSRWRGREGGRNVRPEFGPTTRLWGRNGPKFDGVASLGRPDFQRKHAVRRESRVQPARCVAATVDGGGGRMGQHSNHECSLSVGPSGTNWWAASPRPLTRPYPPPLPPYNSPIFHHRVPRTQPPTRPSSSSFSPPPLPASLKMPLIPSLPRSLASTPHLASPLCPPGRRHQHVHLPPRLPHRLL